jgi:hypothetical protein
MTPKTPAEILAYLDSLGYTGEGPTWTAEEEAEFRRPVVLRNRARCRLCGVTLESTHPHDYKKCRCGNLSVDGGLDYVRRLRKKGPHTVEELSDFEPSDDPVVDPKRVE